jgi:hypothetical protein
MNSLIMACRERKQNNRTQVFCTSCTLKMEATGSKSSTRVYDVTSQKTPSPNFHSVRTLSSHKAKQLSNSALFIQCLNKCIRWGHKRELMSGCPYISTSQLLEGFHFNLLSGLGGSQWKLLTYINFGVYCSVIIADFLGTKIELH